MLIESDSVSVVIDGHQVLHGVSAVCRPGEITGLVGPSGSGKTTLLNCLSLLVAPTRGRVLHGGRDVSRAPDRQRREFWRDHAAFILQDYGTVDDESVRFNVSLASRLASDEARVLEALSLTGLDGRASETAAHLSGGEKQRLGVARAIYKRADVLFADEPTASLDADNRVRVVQLLEQRAAEGVTVVIATHDERLMQHCGSLIEL